MWSDKRFINCKYIKRLVKDLSRAFSWALLVYYTFYLFDQFSFESNFVHRCFWGGHLIILFSLNLTGRWGKLCEFDFREKLISFACSLWAWLNCIFHWHAQLLTFSKSKLSSCRDLFISYIFEKKEASSVKILHIEVIPPGRSFKRIKRP